MRPLSKQYHLFLNGEVLTYNDYKIDLHKLCQILGCCRCKWLFGFLVGSRNFCKRFLFPEKFCFCTDEIESIEWQDLVPWQRLGDCLLIHIPHSGGTCDQPLSSHQTFLHEVELRQCVFCKEPLSFLVLMQTSQFRSFVKWVYIHQFSWTSTFLKSTRWSEIHSKVQ